MGSPCPQIGGPVSPHLSIYDTDLHTFIPCWTLWLWGQDCFGPLVSPAFRPMNDILWMFNNHVLEAECLNPFADVGTVPPGSPGSFLKDSSYSRQHSLQRHTAFMQEQSTGFRPSSSSDYKESSDWLSHDYLHFPSPLEITTFFLCSI